MNYKKTLIAVLSMLSMGTYTSISQVSKNAITATDYSYNSLEAVTIKKALVAKKYKKVATLFLTLSSDNISHITDYLALNSSEEELTEWSKNTKQSEVSQVVLATYYAHKGWYIRGNGYGKEVPIEDQFDFAHYQNKALELYKNITAHKALKAEAYSRLIRVYMSLDDMEKSTDAFEKCIQLDPLKVWAYIHQSEAIQPKWGGNLEAVAMFRKKVANSSDLIQQIISLKLSIDSFISGDDLMGKGSTDFKDQAKELVTKLDKQIRKNPPRSILRYILFNYMFANAQESEIESTVIKYYYKMNDTYTLYPYGIQ